MKLSPFWKQNSITIIMVLGFTSWIQVSQGQIPPPGYERALKMEREKADIPALDRDSLTVTDTVEVFNPEKNENEVQIIVTRYSLRDYCRDLLRMGNPDILLDHQPHTILNPENYEDMSIILRESGKLDTIPIKK